MREKIIEIIRRKILKKEKEKMVSNDYILLYSIDILRNKHEEEEIAIKKDRTETFHFATFVI